MQWSQSHLFENLQAGLRCRLCWLLTLAVFISIVIVEAIILVPSYVNYERDRLLALNYAGQQVVSAAFPDQPEMISQAPAQPMLDRSLIRGVRIHTEPEATFGESVTSDPDGDDNLRARRRQDSTDWMEVRWDAAELGLPYDVSARLDTSQVHGELVAFVWRIIGLVLLITTVVTLTTMAVLTVLVLKPLLALRKRMLRAQENPEHPLSYLSERSRGVWQNEMIQAESALDDLLHRNAEHLGRLKQLNQKLDERVAARTSELEQRNRELKAEVAERIRLSEEAKMLARFPEENTNPVMRASRDGTLLYANASAESLLSHWQLERGGVLPGYLVDLIELALLQKRVQTFEEPCGDQTILLHIRGVESNSANIYGLDISDRKRYENELRHRTWHDDLTNLANRAALEQRIGQRINGSTRTPHCAVMLMGLDDFHSVNMTAGREGGDHILFDAGQRLEKVAPRESLVARMTGDVFAVFLPHCPGNEAGWVSGLAEQMVRALEKPFDYGGQSYHCGLSVGVALSPEDGKDADTLLRHAEMAMLRAKADRSSDSQQSVAFFVPELSDRMAHRQQRLQGLRQALDHDELVLFYQTQQASTSHQVVGVEALVRWRHPVDGMISPGDFIPLAEETGLIVPLGRWVLKTAVAQAAVWLRAGRPVRTAVNMSPQHLLAPGLVEEVVELLAHHDLPADCLELEITESAVINNVTRTIDVLRRLETLGVQLAVDDFGTGYSSLVYLKQLPVHRVKIDQAFVRELPDNEHDATLCRAIIGLSHNLGYSVVAEGVESLAQAHWLAQHDCDELQGFVFSRPQPVETIDWHPVPTREV